ncbi:MAG: tRNA glutamyl-Q(34) synthetase GluQRS [Bacteroidales bacterium]|nr:tRNA glutamyl-Q(34) synthetase GluQRS [Bacteroidales bacterium]
MTHISRFAPSPSGRMHLGNIFAAILSYADAKALGGKWLLRIEDIDLARCKPEYTAQLIDDLHWLGLYSDYGPDSDPSFAPYLQSQRKAVYDDAFSRLASAGLLYECFCSRADLHSASAPHSSDGHTVYPLTCFGLSDAQRVSLRATRKPAWRLHLPDVVDSFSDILYGPQSANLASDRGDIILRRADGNYAYHLAVVVDDALMGVSRVVRGRDLLSAAHEQRFLFRSLGYNPPSYAHFPLLLAPDGNRLSKRDHSLSMEYIRRKVRPDELIGLVAHLLGFLPSWRPLPLADFVSSFSWSRMPKHDIVVDAPALF